jgi:hypothetical protein
MTSLLLFSFLLGVLTGGGLGVATLIELDHFLVVRSTTFKSRATGQRLRYAEVLTHKLWKHIH